MYFYLLPNCLFFTDDKGACVYDLFSGKVWNLNQEYRDTILNGLEGKIDAPSAMTNALINNGLGFLSQRKIYVEPMMPGIHVAVEGAILPKLRLDTIYLVLTGDCGMNCRSCEPRMIRMTGCRYHSQEKCLRLIDYRRIVESAKLLGCSRIVFIGGDPLLESDTVFSVIDYAKGVGYVDFDIVTELLNDSLLVEAKKRNVSFTIQLIEEKGKSIRAIKMLQMHNMHFIVKIVVDKFNYLSIQKIITNLQLEPKMIRFDFIFNQKEVLENDAVKALLTDARFSMRVFSEVFSLGQRRNACFSNQVAVMPNGDVTPCPMLDDVVYFNIKHHELVQGLQKSQFREFGSITKEKIPACAECSMRYACFDCRAVVYALTGDMYGNSYCERRHT